MESEKKRNVESLLYCARCGGLEEVKFDIEKKHVDVNSTDDIGRTALHEAAYGEGGNDYSRCYDYLSIRVDWLGRPINNRGVELLAYELTSFNNVVLMTD